METKDMTQWDMEAIIQTGESYQVEFKRNINSDISKEIVAFANSSGGRIFIGIEDDGTIPWLPHSYIDAITLKKQVQGYNACGMV